MQESSIVSEFSSYPFIPSESLLPLASPKAEGDIDTVTTAIEKLAIGVIAYEVPSDPEWTAHGTYTEVQPATRISPEGHKTPMVRKLAKPSTSYLIKMIAHKIRADSPQLSNREALEKAKRFVKQEIKAPIAEQTRLKLQAECNKLLLLEHQTLHKIHSLSSEPVVGIIEASEGYQELDSPSIPMQIFQSLYECNLESFNRRLPRQTLEKNTLADIQCITSQLLQGLYFLHETSKTVHHDLKPANILLTSFKEEGMHKIKAVIADFGGAESQEICNKRWTDLTPDRCLGIHTPSYVSEQTYVVMQAHCKIKDLDSLWELAQMVDSIALGMSLFETLMGHAPFVTTKTGYTDASQCGYNPEKTKKPCQRHTRKPILDESPRQTVPEQLAEHLQEQIPGEYPLKDVIVQLLSQEDSNKTELITQLNEYEWAKVDESSSESTLGLPAKGCCTIC